MIFAVNLIIVLAFITVDNALSVLYFSPHILSVPTALPSPILLVRSLLIRVSEYDVQRLQGLQDCLLCLSKKSRSFYMASAFFPTLLRTDLIIL